MLEAAVGNGAKEFTLQQEITETSRMDTDIATLLVGAARDGQITLLGGIAIGVSGGGSGRGRRGGLKLLVGVIDEIFLVRHFVGG